MKNNNPDSIREMFDRISPRYVLINKIMTFGQDRYWRKELVRLSGLKTGDDFLDVATGTGDVIHEIFRAGYELKRVTGLDFSHGMLEVARGRFKGVSKVEWIEGDALRLPFGDEEFDVVTSAYLMRNAGDIYSAFAEQFRVLKPGGRIACLDTTPPGNTVLKPFINFYLLKIIPLIGTLFAGSRSAYTYLPETTKAFKSADEIQAIMTESGFSGVSFKKYMFGTISIHYGEKND